MQGRRHNPNGDGNTSHTWGRDSPLSHRFLYCRFGPGILLSAIQHARHPWFILAMTTLALSTSSSLWQAWVVCMGQRALISHLQPHP